MRALVSGAGGFLGGALVRRLRADGVAVFTIGTTPSAGADATHTLTGRAPWSAQAWARALDLSAPDVVFHLAGAARGGAAEMEAVNVALARGLLDALTASRAAPVLVMVGSAAEYGASIVSGVPVSENTACAPVGDYGRTKLAQSNAAMAFGQESGARVVIARIFNAIGVGMPAFLALPDFASQIASASSSGGILTTGNLDVRRDFIDVAHVVHALDAVARLSAASGPINVCSGVAWSLRESVDHMIRLSGKPISIVQDPSRVRADEVKVIVGSTARLEGLGIALPPTDLNAILEAMLLEARARHSG